MPTTRVSAEAIKKWQHEGILCWSIEDAMKDADTCSRETGRPADCYFLDYLSMAKADKEKALHLREDVELAALSAITFSRAVDILAANQNREHRGESMAYDGVDDEWSPVLHNKLTERRLL